MGYVGLDVEDVVFTSGECIEFRCGLDVGDEYLCADGVSLFGYGEANAWGCEFAVVRDVVGRANLMRRP